MKQFGGELTSVSDEDGGTRLWCQQMNEDLLFCFLRFLALQHYTVCVCVCFYHIVGLTGAGCVFVCLCGLCCVCLFVCPGIWVMRAYCACVNVLKHVPVTTFMCAHVCVCVYACVMTKGRGRGVCMCVHVCVCVCMNHRGLMCFHAYEQCMHL